MDIDQLRRNYREGGLPLENLHQNPIEQFKLWMQDAIDFGLSDPTAMTLATVNAEGQPSQRIVLLKMFDEDGFTFFTNYGSKKAVDIEANENVGMHFPWHEMDRQVKISGTASKIPKTESLKYFLSRPRDSQLAAWASKQSHPISSRQFLMSQFESLKRKFSEGEIPLPDFWGGIHIVPHSMEFWQGSVNRLHDRFIYQRSGKNQWHIQRLAP